MYHHSWWRYIAYDESKPRPRVDRALLKRIFAYARPHARSVLIVLVTIVSISLLELIPPLLYRDLIDNVLPNRNVARLNWLAAGMLGIPVLTGLIGVVQRYYSARAGEGIIYDLRQQMYEHLQQMSLRFFTHTKAGEIVSRFNNDVVGAQNAITGTIPNIVTNTVTLVSTLAVMATIEWRLALLSVAVLPLFLLPAKRVARTLRRIRRQAMEHNAEMSNIVSETLSINGALLVKTFGSQARERERFSKTNAAVREIGVRRAQIGQLFFMGMGIAGSIGAALIYWVGGHLVLSGSISVGTIVAFVAYLFRLYGPISALTNVQVEFAQSMVSFERVFEYLDMPLEITERPGARPFRQVAGHVAFEHVWFQYPRVHPMQNGQNGLHGPGNGADLAAGSAQSSDDGAPIAPVPTRPWALEDVSFEIRPGQLAALVGPSGAGKTTITYLLPRLYDPTRGRITLDGRDLRDGTLESLAAQIGMVTQETYLFHDTIRANLLYARPDATQADLERACRAAHIHDLIVSLPEGYDTVVGERGYRLSGGEKQRLAIARVILKDPRILVLDEATSHLDSQSEALIQAALEPLFQGRTSLVIAHRLSTILAADIILVLDQGRLVEQGTHRELLARGGLYAHLYETQFRQGQATAQS
ncbi:ABC transporter ATP-binding protein/permease [Litorilinea aerophila]|uniref:ABC transporter ATP-binding protein n=1 Tax=Litorilinea aerophila TaxID=1204385 RepID=A0A540VAV4_9CHLR|nr:ABC transporter ATP-binding protein [Litorilinea aerophila]MCC9078293.1 ABC transporter ATP-binding protein/permease [Litorilinea aerophila]